jgi:hypothetical protein
VGQDEATKKKSPANNRPARGSTRLPTQISSEGAACHRLRVAPGPAHVPWAPAPTSPAQDRTAPRVPRVTGSSQLQGRHVSRGLQHPPPDAGQLRGRRVSPQLQAGGKTSGRVAQKQSSGRFFLASAARRRAAPEAPRVPAAPGRMKTVELMQKT